MLKTEDNERLCRVGPGTPMGRLFRRYWWPVLVATQLEPGGAPRRVRLLGEDLVVFRSPDGSVGVLDEGCPHRRASLVYARNEDGGLRCIYHGWKVGYCGEILDTPTEPSGSRVKENIRHRAYTAQELGGVIWIHMGGADDDVPRLPDFEWTALEPPHRYLYQYDMECNYLQSLEGALDPAHVSLLHAKLSDGEIDQDLTVDEFFVAKTMRDPAPRIEVHDTRYGFRSLSIRHWDDQSWYVRSTPLILPASWIVPEEDGNTRLFHAVVPVDDTHSIMWNIYYRAELPVDREQVESDFGLDLIDEDFRKMPRMSNLHMQSREVMATESFSGIPGFAAQDAAVQESAGPITDRSIEHLGKSDRAIIRLRRLLLKLLELVEAGEQDLPAIGDMPFGQIRSAAQIIDRSASPAECGASEVWDLEDSKHWGSRVTTS